jgi:hypothetical protein
MAIEAHSIILLFANQGVISEELWASGKSEEAHRIERGMGAPKLRADIEWIQKCTGRVGAGQEKRPLALPLSGTVKLICS